MADAIYKNLYAIVISLFGVLSMITQFMGYTLEVSITKELFQKFNSTFPDESKTFFWAFESSSHFSFLELIIFGILTGAILFLLIYIFHNQRLSGYQVIGDLAIIFAYLGIFCVFNYINDPISIQRPVNWVWALAFAIVCGTSSHLLLLHDRLRWKRNVNTSTFGPKDHKWDFLRQLYEEEISEYRNIFHDLIWVFATLGAGLVLSSILQYTFSMPTEISFSNEFNNITVILFVKLLLLFFGLILGIIYQLMFEIHNIADLIRSQIK